MVDQAAAIDAAHGTKPTDINVQSNIDRILSAKRTTPGSFWGAIVTMGLISPFDETKSVLNFTINDVSPAQRALATQALTEAHRPVNDVTILDYYMRTLTQQKQK
jgi:hypothetical protein